jgi:hypothetical protein
VHARQPRAVFDGQGDVSSILPFHRAAASLAPSPASVPLPPLLTVALRRSARLRRRRG